MNPRKNNKFFQTVGGRKQFNGYVATLLLTGMAPFLGASFPEYSLGILGALGLTSGLIAFEDREDKKNRDRMEVTTATHSISSSDEPRGLHEEVEVVKAQIQSADAFATNGSSNN